MERVIERGVDVEGGCVEDAQVKYERVTGMQNLEFITGANDCVQTI